MSIATSLPASFQHNADNSRNTNGNTSTHNICENRSTSNTDNERHDRGVEKRKQQQAYIDSTLTSQLCTIHALRNIHEDLMEIANEINMIAEVFSIFDDGLGSKSQPFLTSLLTPPCCEQVVVDSDGHLSAPSHENGNESDVKSEERSPPRQQLLFNAADILFGSRVPVIRNDSARQHTMGIIEATFLAHFAGREEQRSSGGVDANAFAAMPLHEHILALARGTEGGGSNTKTSVNNGAKTNSIIGSDGINIFNDSLLHQRLLTLTKSTNSANSGCEGDNIGEEPNSKAADFEQLEVESFVFILPLIERWLSAVSQETSSESSSSLFVKAEAAFVLLHEGLRRFQTQNVFAIAKEIESSQSWRANNTSRAINGANIWARLHAILSQRLPFHATFMQHFQWKDAMIDLAKCLESVALSC